MWQSRVWNGQQAAFRIYVSVVLIPIFIARPDCELYGRAALAWRRNEAFEAAHSDIQAATLRPQVAQILVMS